MKLQAKKLLRQDSSEPLEPPPAFARLAPELLPGVQEQPWWLRELLPVEPQLVVVEQMVQLQAKWTLLEQKRPASAPMAQRQDGSPEEEQFVLRARAQAERQLFLREHGPRVDVLLLERLDAAPLTAQLQLLCAA